MDRPLPPTQTERSLLCEPEVVTKHLAALAGGLTEKEGRAECSVRHLTCAAEFVAKEPSTGVDP